MGEYEIVSKINCTCGECPMWDEKAQRFLWSDILAGKVYCLDAQSGAASLLASNKNVSGFALNTGGGLACATHQGVFLWSRETGWSVLETQFEGTPLKCNDAIADEKGRFIFGTNYYNESNPDYMRGKIYSMDQDRTIRILAEGFGIANGFGFSPDHRTLYFSDSAARHIYAFDYDVETGNATNQRVCVKIPDTEGIPDGMTVDSEGYIWSALWYGYGVARYDPSGVLERKISIPSGQTSSVMFGGADLTDIYITSACKVNRLKIAPSGYDFSAPHNGYTYKVNVGIQGMPEFAANLA